MEEGSVKRGWCGNLFAPYWPKDEALYDAVRAFVATAQDAVTPEVLMRELNIRNYWTAHDIVAQLRVDKIISPEGMRTSTQS